MCICVLNVTKRVELRMLKWFEHVEGSSCAEISQLFVDDTSLAPDLAKQLNNLVLEFGKDKFGEE